MISDGAAPELLPRHPDLDITTSRYCSDAASPAASARSSATRINQLKDGDTMTTSNPSQKSSAAVATPVAPPLTLAQVSTLLQPFALDRKQHPLVFVGIRGYFPALGVPGVNDRDLYDDLIVISTPELSR